MPDKLGIELKLNDLVFTSFRNMRSGVIYSIFGRVISVHSNLMEPYVVVVIKTCYTHYFTGSITVTQRSCISLQKYVKI